MPRPTVIALALVWLVTAISPITPSSLGASPLQSAPDGNTSAARDGIEARFDALQATLDDQDFDGARALADSLGADLTGDDLATAALLQRLGQIVTESNLGNSIPLFRRALAIRVRELGADHDDAVTSAAALAQELIWKGKMDEAAEVLETARAAALATHDPDSEVFILLDDHLGQLADFRSDYAEARRYYERALELSIRHEGEVTRRVGVLQFRLARLDYIQGDNVSANDRYTRSLEVFREAMGPEDRHVGLVLIDRAAVLSDMELFDQSIEDLEQARIILEKTLPPNHPNLAALYHRYGETEMRRGELDAARPWLEKALAIREETLGPDHPNVAATLSKLAQLYRRQGHPELALPILERKLAIYAKTQGVDHPWYAGTLYSMSLNHVDLGETNLALQEALEAERIQRNQLRRETREMAERTGLLYAADRSEGAGLKVALSLAARGLSVPQLRQVWDAQVDARSFVLDELVFRRRALGKLDDAAVAELRDELADASSELMRITAQNPDPNDPELLAARARHERAEVRLAEISDVVANPPRADRVTLADVESALPSETALVAYARYESYFTSDFEYLALIRPPDGTIQCVDLGNADEIDDLVARWREEASDAARDTQPQETERSYRAVAAELRRRIWDPVATKIEGSDMVLVVPDGQLALVSLASLPDDDGGYLVEGDLLVHLLGTERDAVAYRDAADSTGGLLVLGAPAFDAPVGQLTLATSSSGEAGGGDALAISSYRGARSGCGSFRALRFAGLPGSASEVDAVAARWPDDDVTKLTGVDANEASFKALAPRSRVLHLATHGFFLEADCTADDGSDPDTRGIGGMAPTADAPQSALGEKNPLSLSGLALAGANTRQQASRDLEDGILTAEEVAALDLSHVEWAVLSACDTGVGAVHVAEGVLGLRRAFRAAGARSLILSLWAVDDAATRDWMEDLYRARFAEGRSTAEAVRSAERSRLVARRARGESTHPFYWGGFIATGDWH